jgi:hypothetical protein
VIGLIDLPKAHPLPTPLVVGTNMFGVGGLFNVNEVKCPSFKVEGGNEGEIVATPTNFFLLKN